MTQSRSVEYTRRLVTDIAAAPVLKRLLKENVLTEFVTPSSGKVDSSVLSFSHHLIHDYAVARCCSVGRHSIYVGSSGDPKWFCQHGLALRCIPLYVVV